MDILLNYHQYGFILISHKISNLEVRRYPDFKHDRHGPMLSSLAQTPTHLNHTAPYDLTTRGLTNRHALTSGLLKGDLNAEHGPKRKFEDHASLVFVDGVDANSCLRGNDDDGPARTVN